MGKVLALALFILGLIAVACGGAASPTVGVTPGAPQSLDAAPVAFNADMQNFKHQDLTLQAGTTVVWTNRDSLQHTVTSGSPADPDPGSLFDSGSN